MFSVRPRYNETSHSEEKLISLEIRYIKVWLYTRALSFLFFLLLFYSIAFKTCFEAKLAQ